MKTETSRDAAPAAAPEASSGFNLSRWALDHRPLTRYLMVVLMLMGGFTYFQLGQDEDPPFTFRVMVLWAASLKKYHNPFNTIPTGTTGA